MIKDIKSTINESGIDLSSASGMLEALQTVGKPIFVLFIASNDPATGQPWCPDVRAALPVIERVFEEDDEEKLWYVVEVGVKEVWKQPLPVNEIKKAWGIGNIPTLARYDLVNVDKPDGEGQLARFTRKFLVEEECEDEELLRGLRDGEVGEVEGEIEKLTGELSTAVEVEARRREIAREVEEAEREEKLAAEREKGEVEAVEGGQGSSDVAIGSETTLVASK
ncbi:hypothetical protein ABW19_dt0200184 [Dactylella cylindrospora]|nr:hypothetical protein ABW19_dt0200184 [Dactylella cylindrospora]